ncbi:MAG: hypothetical protein V3W44_08485 [Dehalococcoidales bacterium]
MPKKQITQEEIDVARLEFERRGGKVKKLKVEVEAGYRWQTRYHYGEPGVASEELKAMLSNRYSDPIRGSKVTPEKLKALKSIATDRRKEHLTTL